MKTIDAFLNAITVTGGTVATIYVAIRAAHADELTLAERNPEVLWLVQAGTVVLIGIALMALFAAFIGWRHDRRLARLRKRCDPDWSGDNAEAGEYPTETGR